MNLGSIVNLIGSVLIIVCLVKMVMETVKGLANGSFFTSLKNAFLGYGWQIIVIVVVMYLLGMFL